jgi:hypothetical protein
VQPFAGDIAEIHLSAAFRSFWARDRPFGPG